jgi:hypothetical protein
MLLLLRKGRNKNVVGALNMVNGKCPEELVPSVNGRRKARRKKNN